MTQDEFEQRWAKECAEWQAIGDEMVAAGKSPSAFDVTQEQRMRMAARGEKLVSEDPETRAYMGWQ